MRDNFMKIMEEYTNELKQPFKPTENALAKLFINKLPVDISEQVPLDNRGYKVQASVGQGKWTETPWISVFDREITETATKGFYIVYLFRKDMKGFYLSLNQGTTYVSEKYKNKKPRKKMKEVAGKLKSLLDFLPTTFPDNQIDLVSSTFNAKNYMAAHICGKYYSANDFPNNEILLQDLRELIDVYKQLKKAMGLMEIDQFMDYLLSLEEVEDTQFQTDVQLTDSANTPKQPKEIPSQSTSNKGRKEWKRDPAVAKEALQQSGYSCEVDNTHLTFVSQITGKNFVEAHHLIPMKSQRSFRWSLDVPGNIVSICPNCHRRIHHAKKAEKETVITRLYESRKQDLKVFGIEISLEDLKKIYTQSPL